MCRKPDWFGQLGVIAPNHCLSMVRSKNTYVAYMYYIFAHIYIIHVSQTPKNGTVNKSTKIEINRACYFLSGDDDAYVYMLV